MGGYIATEIYASPVGEMLLGSWQGRLCVCDWIGAPRCMPDLRRLASRIGATVIEGGDDVTRSAVVQLDGYFSGQRRLFDIPIEITGTEWQRAVRRSLCAVPYGTTVSYSALAASLGRPEAVRAVAGAIASNPLSIFVPCHRIVGLSGRLTGYRGGIDAKRTLLSLESIQTIE